MVDDPEGAEPAQRPETRAAEVIRAANAAFYEALESGEIGRMDAVWDHGEAVTCAHPGRPPLRGWKAVRRSWEMIFASDGHPQVIVTDVVVYRRGPVAWVTATENMLARGRTASATALNIFTARGGKWLMVAHHAGPIIR